MIANLLPRDVASAELFHDVDEAMLYPEEMTVITNAVPKRRHEFIAGRVCARRALAELGIAAQPILKGETREPVWPEGVVGSITHCTGYRAAAVAHAVRFRAIGIDAEPHAALPCGVLRLISAPNESAKVDRLNAANEEIHWSRLLFSAKESVYKALFPLRRSWLRLKDIHIIISPATGYFSAFAGTSSLELRGQWLVRDGLVLTAVVVVA